MQSITITHTTTFEVPDYGERLPMGRIIELVKRSGSHFFDADTMRFFRSKVHGVTFTGPDGWYFVTSEKHVSPYNRINEPRKYTVRRLSVNAEATDLDLSELEAFQHYPTLQRALTAARNAAKTGTKACTDCRLQIVAVGEVCAECLERSSRKANYANGASA